VAPLSGEALCKIISHCVGVIGYMDGRVDSVEQKDGKVFVYWHNWTSQDPFIFDSEGTPLS
jgi:hypothetical protein